jgi:sugar lactone lactonase YvrE
MPFRSRPSSLICALTGALALTSTAAGAGAGSLASDARRPVLSVAVESRSAIWNAVAVDRGRIFLAGPRWTGSRGPALVVVDRKGRRAAYPDARWNSWTRSGDPASAFVDINAIHLDGRGGLWVVDTGASDFGGDPLPGAAKLVRIDLARDRVERVIRLGADVALTGSYVDDIRFHGDHAYLTDAGRPGLIVVDLVTGKSRRVLDRHPSTVATEGRPIRIGGRILRAPDGKPLRVNADPLEVTPDGRWLIYAPLSGPWSRVPTALLDDPSVSPERLAAAVEPWADLPPTGGTAMAPDGSLYFSDLATDSIRRRAPDGSVTTVIADHRLHWVDAPFLGADGTLWLPVPQMDRVGLFNAGQSRVQRPVRVYRLSLAAKAGPRN